MTESIYGFFGYKTIYDEAIQHLQTGDAIMEIGAFLGKSTTYMTNQLTKHNLDVHFYVLDLWDKKYCSSIDSVRNSLTIDDLYPTFFNNITTHGNLKCIIPLQGKSKDILQCLRRSFKFIFIDGSHVYEDVYADIQRCKELVHENGILAGDDYQHPDVKRAVDELLPDCEIIYGDGNIMYRTRRTWS